VHSVYLFKVSVYHETSFPWQAIGARSSRWDGLHDMSTSWPLPGKHFHTCTKC